MFWGGGDLNPAALDVSFGCAVKLDTGLSFNESRVVLVVEVFSVVVVLVEMWIWQKFLSLPKKIIFDELFSGVKETHGPQPYSPI